ncbi:MAG: hypothetical protein V3T81_01210 [Thermoanaerobaculia bacterium]
MRRKLSVPLLSLLLLVAAGGNQGEASQADQPAEELLHYRWKLGGFVGSVARLFIPGRGSGVLSTRRQVDGNVISELRFTSNRSRSGEYWMHGAEIDPAAQRTLRAWTSQYFRGEVKEKRADLHEEEVIDFASGIHLLRRNPPDRPRRMTIWSNGKLYPVDVLPTGTEIRRLFGERVRVRSYAIRGARVGGQRYWKGKLDLFLADDELSTPVEIRILRRGAKVRLELVSAESRLE